MSVNDNVLKWLYFYQNINNIQKYKSVTHWKNLIFSLSCIFWVVFIENKSDYLWNMYITSFWKKEIIIKETICWLKINFNVKYINIILKKIKHHHQHRSSSSLSAAAAVALSSSSVCVIHKTFKILKTDNFDCQNLKPQKGCF